MDRPCAAYAVGARARIPKLGARLVPVSALRPPSVTPWQIAASAARQRTSSRSPHRLTSSFFTVSRNKRIWAADRR
jgi:hypothetical protein